MLLNETEDISNSSNMSTQQKELPEIREQPEEESRLIQGYEEIERTTVA